MRFLLEVVLVLICLSLLPRKKRKYSKTFSDVVASKLVEDLTWIGVSYEVESENGYSTISCEDPEFENIIKVWEDEMFGGLEEDLSEDTDDDNSMH